MHCLRKAIVTRKTSDFYNHVAAHAGIHGREIRPLDEVLGVESKQEESSFDAKTEEYLDRVAQENLEALRSGRK